MLILPFVLLVGLVLGGVGYIAYVLWPRWPGPPLANDTPAIPIVIAAVTFNVPPAAIRLPVQRRPGTHERIDLAFLWPSLQPPDLSSKPAAVPTDAAAAPSRTPERIFMTISGTGDTLAPADRLRTIYPRYTAREPEAGPNGLAVLAFRDGTPYQGEDLIYDGDVPSNFLVRCSRNGAGPTPGICLYERRIESADLVVRFPRDWLEDWRNVASKIDRLIASLQSKR
jgi:hypothetical protein